MSDIDDMDAVNEGDGLAEATPVLVLVEGLPQLRPCVMCLQSAEEILVSQLP